ncbi:hypothetical protein TRFO_16475 [Tritrichomonas foetus]|uniref:Uncharacterized protein n=1 Tax=Tritrichomonas foetus TaxID=1144522 RepID=A0A1J4KV50_9EUKA|nr:hypothetical protein TRFO_16475 [Tritrichomonas foetus]|eukprot:OHT13381.1 hypothetical protein TRFO_16475 [Tritrichomonas foetus]
MLCFNSLFFWPFNFLSSESRFCLYMNEEESGGTPTVKMWPLDKVVHLTLRFCEKEINNAISQNSPPLIQKKLFSHVLFTIRVRISRLFVIYRWNLLRTKKDLNGNKNNSYFVRLQKSIDSLKDIQEKLQKFETTPRDLEISINPDFDLYQMNKSIDWNRSFHSAISMFQLNPHISTTNMNISGKNVSILSKSKYQFTLKFGKIIHLKEFKIYCYNDICSENSIEIIGRRLIEIIKTSSNPLLECCDFLYESHKNLRFAKICKEFSKYQKYHHFQIGFDDSIFLYFRCLKMKFNLELYKENVILISHDFKVNLKFQISNIKQIPLILLEIQQKASSYILSQFEKQINTWLVTSSNFKTKFDGNFLILFLCNFPIIKIFLTQKNRFYCNNKEFLKALIYKDRVIFYSIIESLELKLISDAFGFTFLSIFDFSCFSKAMKYFFNSKSVQSFTPALISSSNFIKQISRNDDCVFNILERLFILVKRDFIYKELFKILEKNQMTPVIDKEKVITSNNLYGKIIFKISETGYWYIKFTSSYSCGNNLNMSMIFQGNKLHLRLAGWIGNIIQNVTNTVSMIDQAYSKRIIRSISVFHIIQKTAVFLKIVSPFLKGNNISTSPVFLSLQPITFVGKEKQYDIFETQTCLPVIHIHFFNYSLLDNYFIKSLQNNKIDNYFGAFLHYNLPVLVHIFHIFHGDEWLFFNFGFSSFSLLYQSKYLFYFHQTGKTTFQITVPIVHNSNSMILQIPLAIFPQITKSVKSSIKNDDKKPITKRINLKLSELSKLRDSLSDFFSDQKFVAEYGFKKMLFQPNLFILVIKNCITHQTPDFGYMNVLLTPTGLNLEIKDNFTKPAANVLKSIADIRFRDRHAKVHALKFIFDCMMLQNNVGMSFFNCLNTLQNNEVVQIDWERTLSSSSVDVPMCRINFNMFLNSQEYQIIVDSQNEDSTNDANVSVIGPDGHVEMVHRLQSDFQEWLQSLVNQKVNEPTYFEFMIL